MKLVLQLGKEFALQKAITTNTFFVNLHVISVKASRTELSER